MKARPLLPLITLWTFLICQIVAQNANGYEPGQIPSGPFQYFRTEPDFEAVIWNVKNITQDRSRLAPGYMFVAPYRFSPSKQWQPQMIDQDGNLVWYYMPINRNKPSTQSQDIRVCDYLGTSGTHLCWAESGAKERIFNQAYEPIVKDYETIGSMPSPDAHEFNMLPGGMSFLRTVYYRKDVDLRKVSGPKNGAVRDGCFQEIAVKGRREIFGWCFLDHYDITQGGYTLDDFGDKKKMGAGSQRAPWDFCHINAVDKNEEGDYLVSMRHMNGLIKIAGLQNNKGLKPGTPIWRLGGAMTDFNMTRGSEFSVQHCARFYKTEANRTIVGIFNNDFKAENTISNGPSSALFISANNETMQATFYRMYEHPMKRMSPAQGGWQELPNGNFIVGWGTLPEVSEFTADGELLYHARFSRGPVINYRTHKFPWVGKPKQKPKLLAYCQQCVMDSSDTDSPLLAYVSYNGATELASWRFSVSFTTPAGPWHQIGTFPKTGFETMVKLSNDTLVSMASLAPLVLAEALDMNGVVLSKVIESTFVPRPVAARVGNCTTLGCKRGFKYQAKDSVLSRCQIRLNDQASLDLPDPIPDQTLGPTPGEKLDQASDSTLNQMPDAVSNPGSSQISNQPPDQMQGQAQATTAKTSPNYGMIAILIGIIEIASFALQMFWDTTTTGY